MKKHVQILSLLALAMPFASVISCKSELPTVSSDPKPQRLCIAAGSNGSKSVLNPDGVSVGWEKSDGIYVWAVDSNGESFLSRQRFDHYAEAGGIALFATDVELGMPEGGYTYYACYPDPVLVSGMTASFSLPARQDAFLNGGVDIMVSEPCEAGPLAPIAFEEEWERPVLNFKHMIHALKFYLKSSDRKLNGERIERIVVKMPVEVAGELSQDISDLSKPSQLKDGGYSTIQIDVEEQPGVDNSSDDSYFAAAAIAPVVCEGGEMTVKLYSEHYTGEVEPIGLSGRAFLAGHATPIPLTIARVHGVYTMRFNLTANNLGENFRKVTIKAPEGFDLFDGGSEYTVEGSEAGAIGNVATFAFDDFDTIKDLAGKQFTLVCESEHLRYTSLVDVPVLMDTREVYDLNFEAPYLLKEDFSTLATFHSNDDTGTGDKDPVGFLEGWTGARVGGEAGKCIRIACRHGLTWSSFDARTDSAPLAAEIIAPVDLELQFTYGVSVNDPEKAVYATMYVNHTDALKGFRSNDKTDCPNDVETQLRLENIYDGSFDNATRPASFVLKDVPASQNRRITWRFQHRECTITTGFSGDYTNYLYIDNVVVKVKSNN